MAAEAATPPNLVTSLPASSKEEALRVALEKHYYQPKLALAQKALAEITQEHQVIAKALLKLHKDISLVANGTEKTAQIEQENQQKDYSLQHRIIRYLPPMLSSQLETSYKNIKMPRAALSVLFLKFLANNDHIQSDDLTNILISLNGKDAVNKNLQDENLRKEAAISDDVADMTALITDKTPSKNNKRYFNDIIYPAMGTLMECFEHTPRSYTSPYHALGQSKQQEINLKQRA